MREQGVEDLEVSHRHTYPKIHSAERGWGLGGGMMTDGGVKFKAAH